MRRAGTWVTGAIAAVIALTVVSWTSGATLLLADANGRPASGAYVRYHYRGDVLNPVDSLTYVAGGAVIVRADGEGRVRIPGRLHLRRPLPLSGPPRLAIDHVYVPRLHNAFGPLAGSTRSRPGVFDFDDGRKRVTVHDVSDDPERWQRSLRALFGCIRETMSPMGSVAPASPDDARTLALARELAGHLRREHAAFLAAYGQTPRRPLAAPEWATDQERQAWQRQVDAQLEREPLWGPFVERTWRGNLAALDAMTGAGAAR
jgi:hypothetical protein